MEDPSPHRDIEIRIGDRDRSATDAHLKQALDDGVLTLGEYDERAGLCWAARTRGDLEPLTRDLPAYRTNTEQKPAVPAADRPGLLRRVGTALVAAAVLAGGSYLGIQVFGADDGFAAFGSRTITVASDQDRVEAGMIFGSLKIVVPDDVRVDPSVILAFGSTSCEQACQGSGREVAVDVKGAFGSVEILTPAEHNRDGD